jgi:O-antigen/teichoic acid export membrane protein
MIYTFSKAISMIKLVFSKARDTSTAEGRGKNRYRRAGRTALSTFAASAINITAGFIIVPITLSYLGTERYGLWMALTNFVMFLTFTDMGLGIGLQNALSQCFGRDDRESPAHYISSAFLVMVLAAIFLVAFAIFALPRIPFEGLLKISSESVRGDLLPTAQTIIIVFAIGLPVGIFQRVYDAYQQGYWANMWLTIGRVAAFLAVLLCVWFKLGLPALVGCSLGLPFVGMACGAFFLFRKMPWLGLSARFIDRQAMRTIFSTGTKAVIVQFAAVLISSGPALIIANRLEVAAVTPFAVTQKLLATSNIIINTVLMSLWSAYGEAAARNDWDWIKLTFRRSVKLGFAIQIPVFILIGFLGRFIIHVWAGPSAVPTWPLLMAINVWYLIVVWNNCAAITLNGLDHMIGQSIYGPIFASLGLIAGYWLGGAYGTVGVVWSVVCISIAGTAIGCGVELFSVLNKKREVYG